MCNTWNAHSTPSTCAGFFGEIWRQVIGANAANIKRENLTILLMLPAFFLFMRSTRSCRPPFSSKNLVLISVWQHFSNVSWVYPSHHALVNINCIVITPNWRSPDTRPSLRAMFITQNKIRFAMHINRTTVRTCCLLCAETENPTPKRLAILFALFSESGTDRNLIVPAG